MQSKTLVASSDHETKVCCPLDFEGTTGTFVLTGHMLQLLTNTLLHVICSPLHHSALTILPD